MILVAVIVAGYGQANNELRAASCRGLAKFFDYPGEIVVEAWGGRPGLLCADVEVHARPDRNPEHRRRRDYSRRHRRRSSFAFWRGNLNVWPPLVPVARRIMDVMRAFPELIIALFLIFVLGTSPVPAMIAVAFHTAGALGKQFSGSEREMTPRPRRPKSLRRGVVPAHEVRGDTAGPAQFISAFLLRFEINVRASAILGFGWCGRLLGAASLTIGWGKGPADETAALFLLLDHRHFPDRPGVIMDASANNRQRP